MEIFAVLMAIIEECYEKIKLRIKKRICLDELKEFRGNIKNIFSDEDKASKNFDLERVWYENSTQNFN